MRDTKLTSFKQLCHAYNFKFTYVRETRKSLNETAKAIEGAHDVYSGSAQCTAEAVKNIQKTVPVSYRI